MKKLTILLFASTLLTLAATDSASAHVEVSPGDVSAGETVTFTVSVPTELDVPTTEVRVKIPDGFVVEGVDEPSGWRVEEEGGSVSAITWSGGEIPAEASEDFSFEATTPDGSGEFPFWAIQTYADGTVVEWVGSEDSNEPASIVAVDESSGGTESGDGHSHASEAPSASLPNSGGAGYSAIILGLAMVLLGAGMLRRRV